MRIETFHTDVSALTEGAFRGRIFDQLLTSVIPQGRTLVDLGSGPLLFSRRAAALGYEVTAVDARTDRIPEQTGDRITFVAADVRGFDISGFDVVAILGLLYHLTLNDQIELLSSCSHNRSVIVDTQLHDPAGYTEEAGGWTSEPIIDREYEGVLFPEQHNPMASVGNETSFWHTEASLRRLFDNSGFDSLTIVEPSYASKYGSRRFFVAKS
jgi:hypothetical protein